MEDRQTLASLTIADCLHRSSMLSRVSDTPRLDVEIILAHVLQKNRTYLFTWPERTLSEVELIAFNEFFSRRLSGEPVAHITGVREFWSLPLQVDKSTLIPRPDTELLVETVLSLFSENKAQSRKLLDLGTGTGAIALAIAHEKKYWQCLGVDKEAAAVSLAEKNRIHLGLQNIRFLQSDWFSSLNAGELYDVIVSNPPYIDPQDKHLQEGDVRFEPLSALVSEKRGLADLEFIIGHATNYLLLQGWLLVEHGFDQGEKVREFFLNHRYQAVETLRDLNGNERLTLGNKRQNS